MKNRYAAHNKVCATCSFWMGERSLDSSRRLVECVPNTKGDCHEGGIKRTNKMNNTSCAKWQKWGGIR